MTDISNFKFGQSLGKKYGVNGLRFAVDETYWGYTVASNDKPTLLLQIKQFAAMILGAAFVAGSLGLLAVPDFMAGDTSFAFRALIAVLFAGVASFLIWYASRGTQVEMQVDTSKGEIRETVRNRAGRSTRIGTYGFDAIGGVYIDRSDLNPGNAALVLRFGNTSQKAVVAKGTVSQLEKLKDRLGQDLIIG